MKSPSARDAVNAAAGDWLLVLGSTAALTLSSGPLLLYSFAVFIKPLSAYFSNGRGTISLAPAIALVLSSFTVAAAGRIFDRFGLRSVVLVSVASTAVGLVVLGSVPRSVASFVAIYAVLTQISIGFGPVPFAKAISARFGRRRGLALGLAMAGVGVGTALLPLLCQIVISQYGWRAAYYVLAFLVMGIATPAIFFTFPRSVTNRHAPDDLVLPGMTANDALKSVVFWRLALSFFLLALATSGVLAHVAAILSDRGVPPTLAASAISVGGAALILGRVGSGYLLDKISAVHVAVGFFGAALVGVGLIIPANFLSLAWLGTALVGLGLGAEIDLIAYMIGRYMGQRAFGAIYGYAFASFTIGTALGPLAMGASYGRTGNYAPVLLAFAAGLAVAIGMISRLGEYRYAADGSEVANLSSEPIKRSTP